MSSVARTLLLALLFFSGVVKAAPVLQSSIFVGDALTPTPLPKGEGKSLTLLPPGEGARRADEGTPLNQQQKPKDLPPLNTAQVEQLLPPASRATLRAAVTTGAFVQKKQLADLPQPLISSGRFLLARGIGIDWQVQKPFASDFLLTADALMEKSGSSVRRRGAKQQPALAAASRLLLALFALDVASLESEFRFAGAKVGSGWQLKLTPRHAALASAFTEAWVEGDSLLRRVRLVDGRGDVTEISFSEQATQAALTPAQKARFE